MIYTIMYKDDINIYEDVTTFIIRDNDSDGDSY